MKNTSYSVTGIVNNKLNNNAQINVRAIPATGTKYVEIECFLNTRFYDSTTAGHYYIGPDHAHTSATIYPILGTNNYQWIVSRLVSKFGTEYKYARPICYTVEYINTRLSQPGERLATLFFKHGYEKPTDPNNYTQEEPIFMVQSNKHKVMRVQLPGPNNMTLENKYQEIDNDYDLASIMGNVYIYNQTDYGSNETTLDEEIVGTIVVRVVFSLTGNKLDVDTDRSMLNRKPRKKGNLRRKGPSFYQSYINQPLTKEIAKAVIKKAFNIKTDL